MNGTFGLKEKLQAFPADRRKTGLQSTFQLVGRPGQRFEMPMLPFCFVRNARALVAASARGRIMPATGGLAASAAVHGPAWGWPLCPWPILDSPKE